MASVRTPLQTVHESVAVDPKKSSLEARVVKDASASGAFSSRSQRARTGDEPHIGRYRVSKFLAFLIVVDKLFEK